MTFTDAVNMTSDQLEAWLKTKKSKSVGFKRPGAKESVGRQSARKIIKILRGELIDIAHERKVIGYVARHLARPPKGKIGPHVRNTRWRYSLMNWGHDPLNLGYL